MTRYLSLLMFLILPLAGCGDVGGSGASRPSFVAEVDHLYFPLIRGTTRIYEGDDEGRILREVVQTLEETRDIEGVTCTAMYQEVFLDGELYEVTTEWYAQDSSGNVWKFGEESFEADEATEAHGGAFARSEDSWLAGVNDAESWLAFPAQLRVGDRFFGYEADGQDEFVVLSLTATATVPAGTFENCLKLVENPDDPHDTDIILYSRGVGRVSEKSGSGSTGLVLVRRGSR